MSWSMHCIKVHLFLCLAIGLANLYFDKEKFLISSLCVKSNHWEVYIIETDSGRLYTGITTDFKRRFQEHSLGVGSGRGAKFFNISPPKRVLLIEKYNDRSSASKREYQIKKMSRKDKNKLIASAGGLL